MRKDLDEYFKCLNLNEGAFDKKLFRLVESCLPKHKGMLRFYGFAFTKTNIALCGRGGVLCRWYFDDDMKITDFNSKDILDKLNKISESSYPEIKQIKINFNNKLRKYKIDSILNA